MSRWLAILLILASGDVWAHRFAPSLLDIRQIADTTFSATWKTPMQTVSETPIEPKWPDQCAVTSTRTLGSGGHGHADADWAHLRVRDW